MPPLKVIFKNHQTGEVKLRLETLDDLWYLDHLLDAKDTAKAVTYRREETKSDKLRAERGEKRRMYLGLAVEKVEFHDFADRLRVHGTITEGPQDLGSYHTLNLGEGDDVTIVKPIWKRHHQELLKDAEDATKRPLVTILSLDDEEATIAVLRQYGVNKVADIKSNASGKQYAAPKDAKKNYYQEILKTLMQVREEKNPLLVIGPGFAKEEFLKYVREKEPEFAENTFLQGTGQSGISAIYEVFKSGMAADVLKESRVAQESQLVNELMTRIAKGELCEYGPDRISGAVEAGAVETLLVLDTLIRDDSTDVLMESARNVGGKVHIISSSHDSGKALGGLGGLGALLRYRWDGGA